MKDRSGFGFAFRSDRPKWMDELMPSGRTVLEEFEAECRQYMSSCEPLKDEDVARNLRGNHWYMVVGVDRQNTAVSLLFPSHLPKLM